MTSASFDPFPVSSFVKSYNKNSRTFQLNISDKDVISWCMSANEMYDSADIDPIDKILRSEVVAWSERQQKIVLHCLSICKSFIYGAEEVHSKVMAQCE